MDERRDYASYVKFFEIQVNADFRIMSMYCFGTRKD